MKPGSLRYSIHPGKTFMCFILCCDDELASQVRYIPQVSFRYERAYIDTLMNPDVFLFE